jgi:hypothetical protein
MTKQQYVNPCDCGAADDPDGATVCTCDEQRAAEERDRRYDEGAEEYWGLREGEER